MIVPRRRIQRQNAMSFTDTGDIRWEVGPDGARAYLVENKEVSYSNIKTVNNQENRIYFNFIQQNQSDLFSWQIAIKTISGVEKLVILNNKIYSSGFDYSGNRYYYYLTNSGVMSTNYWEYYTIGLPDNYKNRNFWFKVERISAPSSFYITAWSYTLVNYSLDYIPQGDTNISYYFVSQIIDNNINNVAGIKGSVRQVYGIFGYYDDYGYEYGYKQNLEFKD